MANYQKLQVATAINIVPSDDANVPFPNVVTTGISGAPSLNQLEDVTGEFITKNVQVGDIVYNTTTTASATVTQVIDENNLLLNADIFTSAGDSFIIYSNYGKEGCVLYVGTGGNLRILTAAYDDVTLSNVLGGTYVPIQVIKVFQTDTSAANIVALW